MLSTEYLEKETFTQKIKRIHTRTVSAMEMQKIAREANKKPFPAIKKTMDEEQKRRPHKVRRQKRRSFFAFLKGK